MERAGKEAVSIQAEQHQMLTKKDQIIAWKTRLLN